MENALNGEVAATAGRLTRKAALKKVGRFLWHLLQMVVAMEAGMMLYHLLAKTVLANTSWASFTDVYPMAGYAAMEISMVLPMIALMRFLHKSSWAYTLAMSGVMLAPVAALSMLVLGNAIPARVLYGFGDPAMYLAMVVFMLVCPSHHHHHAHAQVAESEAAHCP